MMHFARIEHSVSIPRIGIMEGMAIGMDELKSETLKQIEAINLNEIVAKELQSQVSREINEEISRQVKSICSEFFASDHYRLAAKKIRVAVCQEILESLESELKYSEVI